MEETDYEIYFSIWKQRDLFVVEILSGKGRRPEGTWEIEPKKEGRRKKEREVKRERKKRGCKGKKVFSG